MLSLIMERIRVVSDSPGYIKVREISKELSLKLLKINIIKLILIFCFALEHCIVQWGLTPKSDLIKEITH